CIQALEFPPWTF
nr:immunoglobulin light chain junction region [Macaca mulatta]